MHNWKDLRYLLGGTRRQRHTYQVLEALALWGTLRAFDPVLAGTIPLGVDLPESDLDVVCEVHARDRTLFAQLLLDRYGHLPGFYLRCTTSQGQPCVISGFFYEGAAIEVFGQACPTSRQYAMRHLVVEAAVLQAGGEAWRRAVHRLKQQGLKTEPAFAMLLGLSGDPYEALLSLESLSSADLSALLAQRPLPPLAGTCSRRHDTTPF